MGEIENDLVSIVQLRVPNVRVFVVRLSMLAMLFLVLGLLSSATASAITFEPTGHFGGVVTPPPPTEFPEDVQLGGVGAIAVNRTGAGGVPAGTLYAATRGFGADKTLRIARFDPKEEGMTFVEGWEVRPVEGPYERCGPVLGTKCPNRPEALPGEVDVEVDQATGNLFVFSTENLNAGDPTVAIFNASGSEVIARFVQKAPGGVTTASTPDKIHNSPAPGGLAVDSAGTVYVFDLNAFDNFYHRLMVFKPTTPGDPKTYAYVGEIAAGFFGKGNEPRAPITDAAGDVYVAGESYIEKYSPAQPKTPICKFELNIGGITAMTVNPLTGEPFYYTYKNKQVHRLGSCNEGKFTEVPPAVAVAPQRDNLYALAFDPLRQLETTREPGVLYGATPGPVPGTGGKGEPGMGALGYIFAPVEEIPPVVESEAVSGVGPTSAELEAQINPKGSQTSFRFEYITDADYQKDEETFGEGALVAPAGGAVLGAGQSPLRAAVVLSGLASDTAYRYRVISTSNCSPDEPEKVCEDIGEPESFHTYPLQAAGPPDQRVFELVSPAQKNGGQVLPAEPIISTCGLIECKPGPGYSHFPMQSAPDGGTVVYEGTPFTAAGGAVIENEYIARRTASGWGTVNLTPTLLLSKGGQGYKAFDESLREGILEQISPSLDPSAPSEYTNLYRQPAAKPLQLTPLLLSTPPNRGPGGGSGSFKTTYAGSSADFSHQAFEANDALTLESSSAPEAVDGGEKENNLYEWVNGELRLVNVLPGNGETIPGAVFGSGTVLEGGGANASAVVTNAISDDGSRIFWTSKAGQLYVREDGEVTVEIEDPGKFLTASADGSKVLLSDGCLYGLAAGECEDLTGGQGGFQGIAGQSDDLSRIYFLDTAALVGSGKNDRGQSAVVGKPNLYAYDGDATSFIATLLASDNAITAITGDWRASPSVRSAEASPAGRFLAFLSTAPLTGVDNVGPCLLETGKYVDAPCSEVFLYDSATGELLCPSCNSSGAAPLGRSLLRWIEHVPGSLPQPRYLTDSGRLYFDSGDSLTYFDTNAGVEDVYQYEPQGVGSCTREGGCVSLISAGRGAVDSNFLAMDASGENVFFTTRDRLVAADQDDLIDLYDARVGGGFAAEAQPPIPCSGETCQPPTPVPAEAPSASQNPLGQGNYKPPKCRKGQVLRGGRCVKKPHHKGKKNQGKAKSTKRGGSK